MKIYRAGYMISVRRVGKTLSFYKAGLAHFCRALQDLATAQAGSRRIVLNVMAFRGGNQVRMDETGKHRLRRIPRPAGIALKFI